MKRLAGLVVAALAVGIVLVWSTRPSTSPGTSVTQASRIGTIAPTPTILPSNLPAIGTNLTESSNSARITNVFAAFSGWIDRYESANPAKRKALVTEGRELADKRATALASLIQSDPAAALSNSLSYHQRRALPSEIGQHVEQPLNAVADYEVIGSTPLNPADHSGAALRRAVRVDGQLYEAFTSGTALEWPSQMGRDLNGIVLPASVAATPNLAPYPTGIRTGLAAIAPHPARILDHEEMANYLRTLATEPLCGASGLPVTSQGNAVAAQVGGNYILACRGDHLRSQVAAAGDSAAGTAGSALTTDLPTSATGTGLAGTKVTKGTAKRYIFCRPIFQDYNGYTSDAAVMAAYNGYSNYVTRASYGQLVPQAIGTNVAVGSLVSPPLLLPGTVADYETGGADLTQDIIKALHAAGINLKPYQFFCIVNASKPGFNAAGLGSIGPSMNTDGGSQSWCRLMGDTKSLDPSLLGHELGHNIYLSHSHGWNTGGRSVIGPGANDEYGDPDSLMGATWGRDGYTANLRNYLGWISGASVQTVVGQGLRRVQVAALDDNTNGVQAVRIKHPNFPQYYWLEYRIGRSWIDTKEATESIGVRWGSPNGSEAWWLSVQDDRLGANRLALGHTFTDPIGDIHITPLAILSNSPPTLEVAVAIGPFVSNSPPSAVLTANRTNSAVGGQIVFKVDATDPEGDPLAFGWDFGASGNDGPAALNTNTVSHSFGTAGYYNVRCVVSDMKGGITTANVLVKVGTPAGLTISGTVTHPDGSPLEGIKVQANGGHAGFTDSTGHYTISEVPAGSYSLEASDPVGDDYIFESWLPTPLLVNRATPGANFTAFGRTLTSGTRAEFFSDNALGTLQAVSRTPRIGFPGTGPTSARSARWTGLFNAPLDGNYLFHATGNGAARILLNGQGPANATAIDTDREATAYIRLSEGQACSIQVEFAATDANPALDFTWTTPAGGVAGFTPDQLYPITGGLRGSYYTSVSLTNLAFARIDPTVNFPGPVTSGPRLPGDHYSVRWTGNVRSRNGGLYKFTTTSDDGVRLWVNGTKLVDDWNDHGSTDDTGTISLAANRDYPVVLEYYQGAGGATISLQWTPPGGVREVIPARQLSPGYSGLWAEYYDTETLDSPVRVTQVDPTVDFTYDADAPVPGIGATTFSARWEGLLMPPTNGRYQFSVWADDATRLWINGQKIIDNWGFQGAVDLTGTATLTTNGPVPIRLEMQQIGGNSGIRLHWTPPGGTNDAIPTANLIPRRTGLWAEYYPNPDLSGVAAAALVRPEIDEDYTLVPLPTGVSTSAFSSIWRGRIASATNALHKIILTSAGGARLYWDGRLVLDDWSIHPKHDTSFSTNLVQNVWHDLRIEYRNQTGNGYLQLSWSRSNLTRPSVPSANLLPPSPPLLPFSSQLVGTEGAWQIRWDGIWGPAQVFTSTDLTTAFTNWTPSSVPPVLSNGFWYVDLGQAQGTAQFFRLGTTAQ